MPPGGIVHPDTRALRRTGLLTPTSNSSLPPRTAAVTATATVTDSTASTAAAAAPTHATTPKAPSFCAAYQPNLKTGGQPALDLLSAILLTSLQLLVGPVADAPIDGAQPAITKA